MNKLPLYVPFWMNMANIMSWVRKPDTNEDIVYFPDTQSTEQAVL